MIKNVQKNMKFKNFLFSILFTLITFFTFFSIAAAVPYYYVRVMNIQDGCPAMVRSRIIGQQIIIKMDIVNVVLKVRTVYCMMYKFIKCHLSVSLHKSPQISKY